MYNLTYIISVVYVTAHIILHSNSSTCRCGVCCAMACTAAAPPCQGYDERTCRTVAIETAMKSSAFGFLLASLHFGSFNVRVPSAVSVVWMAIVGSIMAVYWQGKPSTN